MNRQLFSTTPTTLSPSRWHDNKRSCFSFPHIRDIAIYVSGVLFAIGWWAFVDAIVYSTINKTTLPDVAVVDWISGIITTIGMLIVSLIDKTIITDEFYVYSVSSKILWKARLMLFMGFTLLAGGMFCSVSVFVLKCVMRDVTMEKFYFGITVVVQNVCIVMSSIVLLIGQNASTKYDPIF